MNKPTIIAIATETANAYRNGRPDANGLPPERHVSDGSGLPCRHCLSYIEKDKPYLILAHRPFPDLHPYAELGPIFLHADDCPRHKEDDGIPQMFSDWEQVLIKGYGADNRIIYGTGAVVPSDRIGAETCNILDRNDVRYVHVRSAKNNCYMCRVE